MRSPPEIGNLSNLYHLTITGNETGDGSGLTGSIPAEIGNLSNLQEMYLGFNKLDGEIPAEMGNLSKLESLSLSGNQLSGEIPAELGNLRLHAISLHHNQLSGELPPELVNIFYDYMDGIWPLQQPVDRHNPAGIQRLEPPQQRRLDLCGNYLDVSDAPSFDKIGDDPWDACIENQNQPPSATIRHRSRRLRDRN